MNKLFMLNITNGIIISSIWKVPSDSIVFSWDNYIQFTHWVLPKYSWFRCTHKVIIRYTRHYYPHAISKTYLHTLIAATTQICNTWTISATISKYLSFFLFKIFLLVSSLSVFLLLLFLFLFFCFRFVFVSVIPFHSS